MPIFGGLAVISLIIACYTALAYASLSYDVWADQRGLGVSQRSVILAALAHGSWPMRSDCHVPPVTSRGVSRPTPQLPRTNLTHTISSWTGFAGSQIPRFTKTPLRSLPKRQDDSGGDSSLIYPWFPGASSWPQRAHVVASRISSHSNAWLILSAFHLHRTSSSWRFSSPRYLCQKTRVRPLGRSWLAESRCVQAAECDTDLSACATLSSHQSRATGS